MSTSLPAEQNQADPALGNYPTESTREPPTIDIKDSLAKYRISCIVDSVYYYPDGVNSNTRTHACAVVLEVGFLPPELFTPGENFVRATFPTHVPGTRLDRYPDIDEVVPVDIDGCTMKEDVSVALNFQAPGGGGTNLGGYSRQKERVVYKYLRLQPRRGKGHSEIRWQFKNEDLSHYFPSAIKLLLLVRGGSSPCFPFTLEILHTLEVYTSLLKKKWHIWPNTMRLRPGLTDSDGWSCEINDDYFPETAQGFLCEHQKPLKDREPSKMVGLNAALVSTPTVS